MRRFVLAVIALVLCLAVAALATQQFNDLFWKTCKPKAGTAIAKANCAVCHVKMGSTMLNPYGKELKGKPVTTASLKKIEKMDADKDGFSNMQEIKAGTLPGDAKSKPKGKPVKPPKK